MATDALHDVLAKQAITETLYRLCRGIDRADRELVAQAFHPGATADFGYKFEGTAAKMLDWLTGRHEHNHFSCHLATNVLIELDGDRALSECFMFTGLRNDVDGKLVDILSFGRYLDRWSCREERWAIDHRVYVEEFRNVIDVVPGPFTDTSHNRSRADRTDPIYALLAAFGAPL